MQKSDQKEVMSSKLGGERLLQSILVDGDELVTGGPCIELNWGYLTGELRAGGLIGENEVVNQVDIHEDGIRFALTEVIKGI